MSLAMLFQMNVVLKMKPVAMITVSKWVVCNTQMMRRSQNRCSKSNMQNKMNLSHFLNSSNNSNIFFPILWGVGGVTLKKKMNKIVKIIILKRVKNNKLFADIKLSKIILLIFIFNLALFGACIFLFSVFR